MKVGMPRDVLAAKRSLRRAIAGARGVVGVGVEEGDGGRLVLVVLVEGGRGARGLPSEIDGVPVQVRVSAAGRKT